MSSTNDADEGPSAHYPLEDFCLVSPLYAQLTKAIHGPAFGWDLNHRQVQFDAYCVGCKQSATFRRPQTQFGSNFEDQRPLTLPVVAWPVSVRAVCIRKGHLYLFVFGRYGAGYAKIGQSPSAADIGVGDLAELRGILGKDRFSELHKAEGLVSHGAAIGAYAYLRRVLENVIERHRLEYETENGSIEGYGQKRMAEKIEALKSTLPKAVTDNSVIYSILSAGIHTLNEETCAEYYPVVRAALVSILRQDLRRQQEVDDARKLKLAMSAAATKVNASTAPKGGITTPKGGITTKAKKQGV